VQQRGPRKGAYHHAIYYPRAQHLPYLSPFGRCYDDDDDDDVNRWQVFFIKPGVKVCWQYYGDILLISIANMPLMTILTCSKTAHQCTECSAQNHPTANVCEILNFISPSYCPPNRPELIPLITRFSESYSSISINYKSTTLKKSSSNWLELGKAVKQHLNGKKQFSHHSILPYSPEASFMQGEKIQHLLTAYFLPKIINLGSCMSKLQQTKCVNFFAT